jgi:DNA phosphorothioation-dependent restriction protein DptH
MSTAFQPLQAQQLTNAISEILAPRLADILRSRDRGHCMRVADLDLALMLKLATDLRSQITDAQVYILGTEQQCTTDPDLFISSTKLVELRNPLSDQSLRSPLLVFLSADLQTNAEDSFNVASFEDISVVSVYQDLVQVLLKQLPIDLQGSIREGLSAIAKQGWSWASPIAQVRYLLTAKANGNDGDTLGAALYELGLVPDFHLFDEPSIAQSKLLKNLEAVKQIAEDNNRTPRGRVLALDLIDKTLQKRLMKILLEIGVEYSQAWTQQIVIDRANWDLEFSKWKRREDISVGTVQIEILSIDLPISDENAQDIRLQSLIGSKYLAPKDQKKIKVDIAVNPLPSQVPGLAYFTAQIVSQTAGAVGIIKKIKVSTRSIKSFTLDKLDKFDFDEGWHYIRVLAWTEDDTPIPLAPIQTGSTTSFVIVTNESEDFYILPDGELEEDTSESRFTEVDSFAHLQLQLQFKAIAEDRDPATIAIKEVLWASTSKSTQASLDLRCGKDGKFRVSVSSQLKELEQSILNNPENLSSWELNISPSSKTSIQVQSPIYKESAPFQKFIAARSQYFQKFTSTDTIGHLAQSIDWTTLESSCLEYANTYYTWLNDLRSQLEQTDRADTQALQELKQALTIDAVHLTLTDFRGNAKEAILVGPTHPLRAIWFVTWAKIAQHWVDLCKSSSDNFLASTRDSLQSLSPLNIPALQPSTDGRVFMTVDNLNPFWSIYAPTRETDIRGSIGQVCQALELPNPKTISGSITGELLASKIERYLTQHPYIRTLTINVFHLGRANVIADAITSIQKCELGKSLRFDVRLFLPNPNALDIEDSLESLQSSGNETDNDKLIGKNSTVSTHLFPRFTLAVYPTQDFQNQPDRYPAHLSFLFDIFPVEAISAAPAFRPSDTTPLYGLIQDFIVRFEQDDAGIRWQRQPRHGHAASIAEVQDLTNCLNHITEIFSGATATIATGIAAFDKRPVITLALSPEQQNFIYQIHSTSDWVFTIDRNLSIEFFDQGNTVDRPAYLVDYIPDKNLNFGHHLIITSRSLNELESVLARLLQAKSLPSEPSRCAVILDQLRSLSGRLALKLISAPNQQTEVLGLALARMFLAYQGALTNQIIVPLDTHIDLFQTAKRQSDEAGESIRLQRTDLALFDINLPKRVIRCNLVEVKCYNQVGGISDYQNLKEKIVQQLDSSENILRKHFEPNNRPDQLWKIAELTNFLTFYLNRAKRYELIKSDVAEEAEILLTSLEQGYEIQFSRSALIFDFSKTGTDPVEQESGIEFYRIGADLIQKLVTDIVFNQSTSISAPECQDTSLPRLDSAAFLVPDRQYSLSWDVLNNEAASDRSAANLEDICPVDSEPNEEESQQQVDNNLVSNLSTNTTNVDTANIDTRSIIEPGVEDLVPCECDIMLGVQQPSSQFGIFGETAGRKVGLDLSETHTISLFGVQGAGKSYTLGSIIEMACRYIPRINTLPSPLATVVFHYSSTEDYKPEFTSMVQPNDDEAQIKSLRDRYGAAPVSLVDVVILTSTAKVEERQAEYPGIQVLPITFASSELKAAHWKFLMGAVGSQSMYLRQINLIMKNLRNQLTLPRILQAIEASGLADNLKELAKARLSFASEYINDERSLIDVIQPGRLVIVDLRDEFIEKDEALGLFMVMLQLFSDAGSGDRIFNKLIVFDEAHKYMENSDLVTGLVEVVREMRHKGTSILIASQDPASVPIPLIELSSQVILHRFNSPAWLKHLQKAITVLGSLTAEKMSQLNSGEAYVWSSKATDDSFVKGAIKIRCRPRATLHGGATKKAT